MSRGGEGIAGGNRAVFSLGTDAPIRRSVSSGCQLLDAQRMHYKPVRCHWRLHE